MAIPPDDRRGGGTPQLGWDEIFPGVDPRPLRGRSYQFSAAATECRNLKESMEFCSTEFRRLTGDDGLRELDSSSTDALAHLVDQLDGSFHDLPPVFASLASAFSHHHTRLSDLETEAAAALARANTRWRALQTARDDFAEADGALTAINAQIASLQGATDEASAAQLEELQGQLPALQSARGGKSSAVTDAEGDLDDSRTEYRAFATAESELVGETRQAIKDIDLKDLEDPGWLEDKLRDIGEFFTDIADNLAKAFEALINGEFLDALHHLSDALNGILMALAVIVIAVVVVIAVFATGGAALALLAAIATGLAVLKLGIDAILAGTAHPHPETGQPKTWGEVLIDFALLVVPIPGSRVLSRALTRRLLSRVPPAGYTSVRAGRTYRQNERIIAAAERGTGMGSRANGDRLTARQVRERAIAARQYNAQYEAAHATHNANVSNAVETGHGANATMTEAGVDLVAEGAKPSGEADRFGTGDVQGVADNAAVQEGARRHVDRCRRAMNGYANSGPSGRPGTPHVCLVAAP